MPDEFRINQLGRFCREKVRVGGPDIHMRAAIIGTEGADPSVRPWRLAVYNTFCSTPPAAVVWRWEPEAIELLTEEFADWIKENWPGLPIRQNRRPMRSIPKLTRTIVSLSDWVWKGGIERLPEQTYEEAWTSLDDVYTWGRYVKIKFLETMRRTQPGCGHLEAPNIRASGGWSPRAALAVCYPEHAHILADKSRNDRKTINFVHAVAEDARQFVVDNYVDVSNYQVEALLCNYRQTLSERKAFYVGRTIDSELAYDRKVRAHFGPEAYADTFDFFKTRTQAFPPACLGEKNGWDDVRLDISPLLREYDIVWTDLEYDYQASKEDLSHPVRWGE